jgi:hypothetical protein
MQTIYGADGAEARCFPEPSDNLNLGDKISTTGKSENLIPNPSTTARYTREYGKGRPEKASSN